MLLLQEAFRAFSISSFLERRYSLRSKSLATVASSTVARRVAKAVRDVLVVVVKAAAEEFATTSIRANLDMDTIFDLI